jgi:peptidyl-prolyl cis-trans isomerase SurA
LSRLLLLALLLNAAGMVSGAVAAELTVNKIAAMVNGEIITLHEVRTHAAAELSRMNIPPDSPRAREVAQTVLETMITNILLRQEATRMKLAVADNEVEGELQRIMQQGNIPSREAFEQELKRQGASIALVKERIKDSILRQRMISFMIARKVLVTQEEISDYYNSHKGEFSGARVANFSVVVFPPSVKGQQLYEQLKSGTLGFEDAARQYSIDASAKNGGNVGDVPWNSMSPKLHNVLNTLKDGEISPPLKFEKNIAVVRRNFVRDGGPQTLDEASGRIEEILREPKLQERFKEYAQQLRDKAVVDVRM